MFPLPPPQTRNKNQHLFKEIHLTEHSISFTRLLSLSLLFAVSFMKKVARRKVWRRNYSTPPSLLGMPHRLMLQEVLFCKESSVNHLMTTVVWRRSLSTITGSHISVKASILIVLVNLILVASCLGSVKLWETVEKMWLLVDAPVKSNWKSFLICV